MRDSFPGSNEFENLTGDSMDDLIRNPLMRKREEAENAWYNLFTKDLKKYRKSGLTVEKELNTVRIEDPKTERFLRIHLFSDGRPIKVLSELQADPMTFESNQTAEVDKLIKDYFSLEQAE